MTDTLYWHDYETSGANPALDYPVQFAGQRTDLNLQPVGEPLTMYCRPAPDMLPQPAACLITGITPQKALADGIIEAEFIRRIHAELAQPGTCTVGYNNLRFDDEVTRYTLYRNFYDPYAREYQNGNSRWDIIDLTRVCYALRPEGIEWPRHADGNPSFRLEDLSRANSLAHESAHDAMSDVQATIALARLIKSRQPKLYDYAFTLKHKQTVTNLLNVRTLQPVLHTSSMFASAYGCTTVVAPLALHPTNKNGVIVYDLRHDPQELLEADGATIRERLFTRNDELPDDKTRFHLKTVHINKSPMLAPLNTLTDAARERLQLDMAVIDRHLAKLKSRADLPTRVRAALAESTFERARDVDQMLYDGFFGDADRQRIESVRNSTPQQLASLHPAFDDARLPELLFRYRARNWPQTLSAQESERWRAHCRERLHDGNYGGLSLAAFDSQLQQLAAQYENDENKMAVLEALAEYAAALED